MVSFLPKGAPAAARSGIILRAGELTWVDVTAPGDGCAFALCDPVAVSGVAPEAGKRWPLVISAAFTQTLSPERWRAALALLPAAFPVSLRLRPARATTTISASPPGRRRWRSASRAAQPVAKPDRAPVSKSAGAHDRRLPPKPAARQAACRSGAI
jgi:hypothetical protein